LNLEFITESVIVERESSEKCSPYSFSFPDYRDKKQNGRGHDSERNKHALRSTTN